MLEEKENESKFEEKNITNLVPFMSFLKFTMSELVLLKTVTYM